VNVDHLPGDLTVKSFEPRMACTNAGPSVPMSGRTGRSGSGGDWTTKRANRSDAAFRVQHSAWAHKIKHDGYRLIVRRDGKLVQLFTRRGHNWTERYPGIAATAAGRSHWMTKLQSRTRPHLGGTAVLLPHRALLTASAEGAARIDLTGQPAGTVSGTEAQHATEKLAALSKVATKRAREVAVACERPNAQPGLPLRNRCYGPLRRRRMSDTSKHTPTAEPATMGQKHLSLSDLKRPRQGLAGRALLEACSLGWNQLPTWSLCSARGWPGFDRKCSNAQGIRMSPLRLSIGRFFGRGQGRSDRMRWLRRVPGNAKSISTDH
jgi:ProQ/FINO family